MRITFTYTIEADNTEDLDEQVESIIKEYKDMYAVHDIKLCINNKGLFAMIIFGVIDKPKYHIPSDKDIIYGPNRR